MKFLKWLTQYNKALVPLTMAIIFYLNTYYGIEIPLKESDATILWGIVTAFLTFLIPNTEKDK